MKTSKMLLNILPLLLVGGAMVYAAAPGGGYLPGATTNPDCAPGDTDCFVQIGTGAGDNLGNHTATQNLNLNDFQLVGSGGTQGIFVNNIGNIGINTVNPLNRLHVQGNILGGIYNSSQTDDIILREHINFKRAGLGINPTTNYFSLRSNGNAASGTTLLSYQYESSGGDVSIMSLAANGNVGIGTLNPLKLLDISSEGTGSVNAGFTSALGTNILSFDRSNGTTTSKTQLTGTTIVSQLQSRGYDELGVMRTLTNIQGANEGTVTSTGAPGSLRFLTSNIGSVTPTEKMRITSQGNVGIGTISPVSPLHIDADDASNVRITRSGSLMAILGDLGSTNHGQLNLYNASGSLGVLISSGNYSYFMGGDVGIGTNTPSSAKLEVHDTTTSNMIISNEDSLNGASTSITFEANEPTATDDLYTWKIWGMNEYTSRNSPTWELWGYQKAGGTIPGRSAFIVAHALSGNVGINVGGNPTAKLDVGGNIKIANSNATCAAGNAGEIRYDTATNKHQGCNGTLWNDLY